MPAGLILAEPLMMRAAAVMLRQHGGTEVIARHPQDTVYVIRVIHPLAAQNIAAVIKLDDDGGALYPVVKRLA